MHGKEDTEITLRVSVSDIALKIEVADNGKGMRPEGSGLGLAVTKGIIELHGGTISVASAPTVGTTFLIEFCSVKVN